MLRNTSAINWACCVSIVEECCTAPLFFPSRFGSFFFSFVTTGGICHKSLTFTNNQLTTRYIFYGPNGHCKLETKNKVLARGHEHIHRSQYLSGGLNTVHLSLSVRSSTYEFSLERNTQTYTYFSIYEHHFYWNEKPTFVRASDSYVTKAEKYSNAFVNTTFTFFIKILILTSAINESLFIYH